MLVIDSSNPSLYYYYCIHDLHTRVSVLRQLISSHCAAFLLWAASSVLRFSPSCSVFMPVPFPLSYSTFIFSPFLGMQLPSSMLLPEASFTPLRLFFSLFPHPSCFSLSCAPPSCPRPLPCALCTATKRYTLDSTISPFFLFCF